MTKTTTFPNCIIAILGNGSIILVKDGTEYEEGAMTLSEILELSEDGDFGILSQDPSEQEKCFMCDVQLISWRDNTPDSSDYNLEVYFENMRELK